MKLRMIDEDLKGARGDADQRVSVVGGVEHNLSRFEGAHVRIGEQARAEFIGLV